MAKITAPNPEFRGVRHGVSFHNGQAESDDPIAIGALLRAGYQVDDTEEQVHHADPIPTRELADHTVKELEAIALEEGIDLAGCTLKTEKVAAIEAARGA